MFACYIMNLMKDWLFISYHFCESSRILLDYCKRDLGWALHYLSFLTMSASYHTGELEMTYPILLKTKAALILD